MYALSCDFEIYVFIPVFFKDYYSTVNNILNVCQAENTTKFRIKAYIILKRLPLIACRAMKKSKE